MRDTTQREASDDEGARGCETDGSIARVRGAFAGAALARHRVTGRFTPRKLRREARAIAPLVDRLEPGRRIDVACGAGALGAVLHRGHALVGVDSSREMAAAAREADGYVSAVVADASRLPFPSATFASGCMIRLLHHLDAPGRRAVLAELRRVVRGPVVVSLFDARTLEAWRASLRRSRRGSRHAVSLAEFAADAEAAGWRMTAVSRKLWRLTEHVYALLTPLPGHAAR